MLLEPEVREHYAAHASICKHVYDYFFRVPNVCYKLLNIQLFLIV